MDTQTGRIQANLRKPHVIEQGLTGTYLIRCSTSSRPEPNGRAQAENHSGNLLPHYSGEGTVREWLMELLKRQGRRRIQNWLSRWNVREKLRNEKQAPWLVLWRLFDDSWRIRVAFHVRLDRLLPSRPFLGSLNTGQFGVYAIQAFGLSFVNKILAGFAKNHNFCQFWRLSREILAELPIIGRFHISFSG